MKGRGRGRAPPRERACAVAVGEVAPLQHEARDDAVEGAAQQVQRLPAGGRALLAWLGLGLGLGLGSGLGLGLGGALLARAQRSEVLRRPRHLVAVQAALDAARRLAADRELEEDARCAIEGTLLREWG